MFEVKAAARSLLSFGVKTKDQVSMEGNIGMFLSNAEEEKEPVPGILVAYPRSTISPLPPAAQARETDPRIRLPGRKKLRNPVRRTQVVRAIHKGAMKP